MEFNRMRLNRLLARHGICSRRKADEWIVEGRVSIDGIVCRELGTEVDPDTQRIAVDGKLLTSEPTRFYVLLNKPIGVVSTKSDPQRRKTVVEYLPGKIRESGIFPVGRLDSDSEGLLLLTNDGDWSQVLLHPSHQVWKEYEVRTDKPLVKASQMKLESGVYLDGKKTIPAKIKIDVKKDPMVFRMQIREGRNRQIRRMCQKVGLEVVELKRIAMGPIRLGPLPSGQWRHLTETEVLAVFDLSAKQKSRS